MERKYNVPAIERANQILNLIASEPSKLRLIDISKKLNINKSSMYFILTTMENMGWVQKEKGDTYILGPGIASLSAAYFRQFNILNYFYVEAEKSGRKINENIQLGILDSGNVVYLAKKESQSPIRMVTDPGMKFPAYCTAIGKALLLQFNFEQLKQLYPSFELEPKTPNTIKNVDLLYEQLKEAAKLGYTTDLQEGALGFFCTAAPIKNSEGKIIAAVSFTMLENSWNEKKEAATEEIMGLAGRLSAYYGFRSLENI